MRFFGARFSFNRPEMKQIREIRKWAATNFAKHRMLTNKYLTQLVDVPEKGGPREDKGKFFDFDLQAKVV